MNPSLEPSIDSLSKQLPERKGVWWAVQSAKKVQGSTSAHDKAASEAAEAWVKNPNPKTKAAAELAAKKTDFHGPGAWAAQAAAWSAPASGAMGVAAPSAGAIGAAARAAGATTVAAPGAGALGGASVAGAIGAAGQTASLVPHAVGGSVKLAAALAAGHKLAPSAAVPALPAMPALPVAQPGTAIPQVKMPTSQPPPLPTRSKAEQAALDKMHRPFIDLGKDILAGRNTW